VKNANNNRAGNGAQPAEGPMAITLESIARDRMVGEIDQTTVNLGLHAWSENAAPHARMTLPTVRALAERRVNVERFPQYSGHFDGFEVVRVTSSVSTKAGEAFKAGDLSLGRWEEPNEDRPFGAWVVFSFRNGVDTSVLLKAERFNIAAGR